ncbi:MAG: hypothetical protein NWF00_04580 [Candidatus Bathyarchaeota archaeon]|nr:hypothetical protein [Candidatus Bathyarchaeota archaeon]
MMDSQSKKFHFQEIDWVISFPVDGNKGKYREYAVVLLESGGGASEVKSLRLGEILDRAEIDNQYPHTVGYYKTCAGKDADFKPEYLELREIRTVEEFWAFLNAANL